MTRSTITRGEITYDDYFGHVCTCTGRVERGNIVGLDGETAYTMERTVYEQTVGAVRDSATETGSYWYTCSRCGAGGWSGL
ncbi:MAG: hypothetical protein NUW01_04490 [Gemmatimonadaceae bacterium]|nr:hypothetical protein [Gemmatimonadaceae bacterium]